MLFLGIAAAAVVVVVLPWLISLSEKVKALRYDVDLLEDGFRDTDHQLLARVARLEVKLDQFKRNLERDDLQTYERIRVRMMKGQLFDE